MMVNLSCQTYTFGKREPEQNSLQRIGSWDISGAFSRLLINAGEPSPWLGMGYMSGRYRSSTEEG